jgi:tetratricopeptide (TPR) repeat protein
MTKQDQFPLQDYGERSMLTTWKVSYDQVLRRSETAAWLLRLWAFFHHDDFWYELLAKSGDVPHNFEKGEEFETPAWLAELSGSELEFSSAMGLLNAYSLAGNTGGGSYTMHPVLHRWSRSFSLDTDAAPLISVSICVLASASPSGDDATSWQLERRVLQHVLHACNELRVMQTVAQLELRSRVTNHLGLLLYRQEKLGESEQMYQRALSAQEKALGPNHTSTFNTFNNLGVHYEEQGKLDEAEQMYQRALASHEKTHGTETLTVQLLGIVNNLGNFHRKQGRLDEAEGIYIPQLTISPTPPEMPSHHLQQPLYLLRATRLGKTRRQGAHVGRGIRVPRGRRQRLRDTARPTLKQQTSSLKTQHAGPTSRQEGTAKPLPRRQSAIARMPLQERH